MRILTIYLFLSGFFLFLFFGCNTNDLVVEIIPPDDLIEEITSSDDLGEVGIPGHVIPGFYIEYLDKELKPYRLLDSEELMHRFNDKMTLILISAIDEITGRSFLDEPQEGQVSRNIFGWGPEIFEYSAKETIRRYNIKYKVPSIKGDSVEEIILIAHYVPCYANITAAWYNGKEIPLISRVEIWREFNLLPVDHPDKNDREVMNRINKESYYRGDLVGVIDGSSIEIVVPAE